MRLFDAGARDGRDEVVQHRVVTVPNAITAARLLGLPVFVWLVLVVQRPAAAFWTLVAVASTDWLDGYVARRFNQVSRIGQLIDPLVDRVVLVTAGLTLAVAGIVPPVLVAAIIVRDVAVLAGALALFGQLQPMSVTRLGKFSTACLLVAFPLFLVAEIAWSGTEASRILAVAFATIGVVTYYAAAVQYAQLAVRLRQAQRSS